MNLIKTKVGDCEIGIEVLDESDDNNGYVKIRKTEDIKKTIEGAIEQLISVVRAVADNAGKQLGDICKDNCPSKVEIELSLGFGVNTGLWIITAKSEGIAKAKLSWERKPSS